MSKGAVRERRRGGGKKAGWEEEGEAGGRRRGGLGRRSGSAKAGLGLSETGRGVAEWQRGGVGTWRAPDNIPRRRRAGTRAVRLSGRSGRWPGVGNGFAAENLVGAAFGSRGPREAVPSAAQKNAAGRSSRRRCRRAGPRRRRRRRRPTVVGAAGRRSCPPARVVRRCWPAPAAEARAKALGCRQYRAGPRETEACPYRCA